MRLVHVSDWHLGRQTYRHSRADDHDAVIAEILAIATEARPDLIIHTGDLFDSFRPPAVEMTRGVRALNELALLAPVLVIAGNHDSRILFSVFNELIGEGRPVRFVDRALPAARGGVLEYPGRYGEIIRIAPIPFIHANRYVEFFEDARSWTAEYATRIHAIEENLRRGLLDGYDTDRHVLLFAAHLYVEGATLSSSERPLTTSDSYASRPERIPQVSYAAFGHIHKPQALKGGITGRYAGSPIQLDFGEESDVKEVVLVEALPGRPAKVMPIPLTSGRRLRLLSGTLEELAAEAPTVGQSLCKVLVRTQDDIEELSDRVRELFPEAVLLDVQMDSAASRVQPLMPADISAAAEESFTEMFHEYLLSRPLHGANADRVLKAFGSILDAIGTEDEVVFDEDALMEPIPELPTGGPS